MGQKKIYNKKTVAQLKAIAVRHFHQYIRNRDQGEPCISCGQYKEDLQAGHFHSAGKHPSLKFNEDNVHGQCLYCNFYLHGNLIPYSENLITKIGKERYDKLTFNIQLARQVGYKWDRFFLIELIETYKEKNKL